MQRTYHLNIGTMVDLYYNDLHSARVTINTIKASLEDKEDGEDEDINHYNYSQYIMHGRKFRKLST